MLRKIINVFKISGIYIGIIIGAGFASGQEITSFFAVHGEKWIYGIILMGLLFTLIGWAILDIIYEKKVNCYFDFMNYVLGKKIGLVMEWISGFFLCVLFFTMTAASGALAHEAFNINYGVGVVLILLICFIIFLFDVKGVIFINSILSPFMILSGILVGCYIFLSKGVPVFATTTQSIFGSSKWIFSAFLYVSYNIITAISVLISVKHLIISKGIAKWAGIVSGISMATLGGCIGFVMFLNYDLVKGMDIPLLVIVSKYSNYIQVIYILMLISAIITTAVGNGFGALKWFETKVNIHPMVLKLLFILFAAIFSLFGFSSFVGKIYPLFGYIGLFEIFAILIRFFLLKD